MNKTKISETDVRIVTCTRCASLHTRFEAMGSVDGELRIWRRCNNCGALFRTSAEWYRHCAAWRLLQILALRDGW